MKLRTTSSSQGPAARASCGPIVAAKAQIGQLIESIIEPCQDHVAGRYLLERRIEANVAVNKLLYVSDKFLVGIFFKEQYRVGTHNCRRPI
jgi:hypothetical protein